MPEAIFVLAPTQNQFFFELAAAIRYELEACGVPTSLSTQGFPEPRAGRAYILLPPHEYYALEGYASPPDAATFNRTILICCEQPETVHFDQNLAFGRGAAAVFDINQRSVRVFRHRGLSAEHLRIGYTPYWDRFDDQLPRPVDIAFLGAYTARRAAVLGGSADLMGRYQCELHLSDNSQPNSAQSLSFLADERKWGLLSRAKTLLNIHQGGEPYFEWLRVIEAIHAGCVVISEASSDYRPLVPGEHLVMGRQQALGFLAEEMLEDPASLSDMRRAAHALLREQLPMRQSVERLAEAVHRAGSRPVAGRATNPRLPAAPELRPNLVIAPPAATADPDASAVRRALKETQLQLMDLRRGLARLSEFVGTGNAPQTRIDLRTSSFRGRPYPRISVLIPLYNHADHIESALDSIAGNRFKDLEIIVVNDGSTDDSLSAARRWMRHHDHVAGAVISHTVNRGLPHARNTALDFARGELVLIFDADNLLLPQCLQRLINTLDSRPQASFAYGILSGFDAHGPRQLLSQFEWEPTRLRRENYVDALALIKISVLRAVGGFKTDRRLYGVEDWDMWATMADHGYGGVLVPEIVARYRVSPSSMLSVTSLSPTIMYATMIERHPELMRGVEPPL
ncbi:MAG: glycosyltransferase family 2 protein [Actinomycetota bacterium]|nr:glycosyltransferase family 2 protein [Actinomycetota bacterium]